MELKNKKLVVIGGAGLIGSYTVEALLKEDVKEVIIYDNFVRGTHGIPITNQELELGSHLSSQNSKIIC